MSQQELYEQHQIKRTLVISQYGLTDKLAREIKKANDMGDDGAYHDGISDGIIEFADAIISVQEKADEDR